MFQRIRPFLAAFVVVASGFITACGGGSSSSPTPVPTPTPDANVAGNYTLTLTTSSVCDALIPKEVRVTEYTATLVQSGTRVSFNAVGKVGAMVLNGSSGTVSGNTINLTVSFAEQRDQPIYIYQVAATGAGQVQGSAISTSLNGLVQYLGPGYAAAQCSATDHRLEFTKQ